MSKDSDVAFWNTKWKGPLIMIVGGVGCFIWAFIESRTATKVLLVPIFFGPIGLLLGVATLIEPRIVTQGATEVGPIRYRVAFALLMLGAIGVAGLLMLFVFHVGY